MLAELEHLHRSLDLMGGEGEREGGKRKGERKRERENSKHFLLLVK